MSPYFSIIVPVFKTEKFIDRCISSILNQTFTDWEAILVDDGSPDRCPEILDGYASRDSRIRVIHQQNAGMSAARNAALEVAGGRFIYMMDSDDFIHPQMLEICRHMLEGTGADMVTFRYSHRYHTTEEIRHALRLPDKKRIRFRRYDPQKMEFRVVEDIFNWTTENSHPKGENAGWMVKHCQAWRCVLRSTIARNIKFPTGVMYEDMPWWGEVLLSVRKTCILKAPLYFYYPNWKGLIHSSGQKFRLESLEKAILCSRKTFDCKATDEQKRLWEENFLSFFEKKAAEKRAKLK